MHTRTHTHMLTCEYERVDLQGGGGVGRGLYYNKIRIRNVTEITPSTATQVIKQPQTKEQFI